LATKTGIYTFSPASAAVYYYIVGETLSDCHPPEFLNLEYTRRKSIKTPTVLVSVGLKIPSTQTQIAESHSPRKAADRIPSFHHILKTSLWHHPKHSVSIAATGWMGIAEGEEAIQKIREMTRR